MSFPAYPDYKDSGAEWLGEVPSHWEVDRIKWSTFCCKNGLWGDDPQNDSNDFPCVRVADFDRRQMRAVLNDPTIRNVGPSERVERVLRRGDLVLEKSGGGEKQPVGFVVLYDDDNYAICSNFTARVALERGMDPSFWRYVHGAAYSNRLNVPSIKQTSGIQNLDQKRYFDERAAFPPAAEQQAIAHFLEYETARIDALIEEQQRLIELLKEKRQAVISRAVTKGLDPEIPMKNSGVEWLGTVPKHWLVGRITQYLESVVDYRGRTPTKDDDGVLLITAKNVRSGTIDYSAAEEYITYEAYKSVLERGIPKIGDVVLTTEAPLGEVANLDMEDVALAQRIIKLRADTDWLDSYFLKYWIMGQFCQEELYARSTGSTVAGIKGSKINQLTICLPPLEEQRRLVRFVEESIASIDRLTESAHESIELLNERRSALISAAVTGKIDVRGWKPAVDRNEIPASPTREGTQS